MLNLAGASQAEKPDFLVVLVDVLSYSDFTVPAARPTLATWKRSLRVGSDD